MVLTANPSALGDASYFELDSISVASADGSSADVLGYPSSVTTTQPSSVTPPDLTEFVHRSICLRLSDVFVPTGHSQPQMFLRPTSSLRARGWLQAPRVLP